ncbi:MAG: exopolysaccharide biosynthesis polyprenyl glycosylphosphotransferase, partial [Candidatus Acidiferrales bacterium]
MIRLLNAYFPTRTLFLGISEACLIALAFIAAMIGWLGLNDGSIVLNYEQGFVKILIVSAAFIVCMYYFDLYDSLIVNNPRELYLRLIQAYGTVSILLACIYYLYPPLKLGRGVFLIGFISAPIVLVVWRTIFLRLSALPRFAERTLLIGNGLLTESIMAELSYRPILGLRIVGQLRSFENLNGSFDSNSREKQISEIVSSIEAYQPDRVIVTSSEWEGGLPLEPLLELKNRGVRIQDGAEAYEIVTGKIPLESLGLESLLFSAGFQVSRSLLIYKRIASIIVSAIGLLVTLPLMPLIAAAIRLDSNGPIIFRQRRVGQSGKIFILYKFRTMIDGADQEDNYAPAEILDRRFTRVGRFLRRARLDEIPQFFNIFRGDMHFIGPRPFVPNQEETCVEKIPFYRQRWVIKPGATGWAQV